MTNLLVSRLGRHPELALLWPVVLAACGNPDEPGVSGPPVPKRAEQTDSVRASERTSRGSVTTTGSQTCRDAGPSYPPLGDWQDDAWPPQLAMSLDLDGDSRVDRAELTLEGGSGGHGIAARVHLASGTSFEVVEYTSFYSFVGLNPVPDDVYQSEALRRGVENLLFRRVCTGWDSLLRFLSSEPSVRWESGPPPTPTGRPPRSDSYTAYVADSSTLGRVLQMTPEGRRFQGPVWVNVLGQFGRLRELGRRGDVVLVATDHSVLLTNPERTRHAWLYVFDGSMHEAKLRFRSIDAAHFRGGLVDIHIAHEQGAIDCTVTVDLSTGTRSGSC